MKKRAVLAAAFIFSLIGFSCAKERGNPRLPERDLYVHTAGGALVRITAEIADTDETREKGYMFRKEIPDGSGMLFVYGHDLVMRFWMKNTPTPLSIAYIDYKGIIKDIFDMKPFNLDSVTSTGYVRYALEVPQGFFERAGICPGDKIDLSSL